MDSDLAWVNALYNIGSHLPFIFKKGRTVGRHRCWGNLCAYSMPIQSQLQQANNRIKNNSTTVFACSYFKCHCHLSYSEPFSIQQLGNTTWKFYNVKTVTSWEWWLVAWLSGNALVSINEVTLRRARLVLGVGWVTVCERVNHLGM